MKGAIVFLCRNHSLLVLYLDHYLLVLNLGAERERCFYCVETIIKWSIYTVHHMHMLFIFTIATYSKIRSTTTTTGTITSFIPSPFLSHFISSSLKYVKIINRVVTSHDCSQFHSHHVRRGQAQQVGPVAASDAGGTRASLSSCSAQEDRVQNPR